MCGTTDIKKEQYTPKMSESHLRHELQSILDPSLASSTSNDIPYRASVPLPVATKEVLLTRRSIVRKICILILLILVGFVVTNLEKCMSYMGHHTSKKEDNSHEYDDPLFQRFN